MKIKTRNKVVFMAAKQAPARKSSLKAHSSQINERSKPLKYGFSDSLLSSIMFTEDGERSVGSFDNMAQAGCCDIDIIPKNARIIAVNDGTRLAGVEGLVTEAGTLYKIVLYRRVCSVKVPFRFRGVAISTPGLRFLWDIEQIRDTLGGMIDTSRSFLRASTLDVVIQCEPVDTLRRRCLQSPIRTLGACGGIASDLIAMIEMGFNISEHTLVESNKHAVVIAEMIADFANIKLTVFDDIKTVVGADIGFIHSAVFTRECRPWNTQLANLYRLQVHLG